MSDQAISHRDEAAALCRYLIGEAPSPALAERYGQALSALFPGEAPSPALSAALRSPAALALLDAATALRAPDDPLHKRLLLMTALLEASPDYALDHFLPRAKSCLPLVLGLAWNGARAAAKALLGIPLLVWIEHRSRRPA